MKVDFRLPANLTGICLISGMCFCAEGSVVNTATIAINPNFSGGSGPYNNTINQAGTIDTSATATGGANSIGHAVLHVEYGRVTTSGDALVSLNSATRGTFRDDLTFTAPGVPTGTLMTVTYSVKVRGRLAAGSGSSASSWRITADIGGGASDISRQGNFYSPELPTHGYSGDPFGTYTGTATVQCGFRAQLSVELQCNAGAANTFQSTGSADFGDPIVAEWAGIQGVSVNGTPLPTFTVASVTGINWTNPHACPADFNGDGFADGFDYDDFVACFEGDPCPPGKNADFNNDGFADGFDYDDFVAAFEVGCS